MKSKERGAFCGSVKVGSKGQVVLPIDIRKKFNIKEGEILFVLDNDTHIKIMKSDVLKKLLEE